MPKPKRRRQARPKRSARPRTPKSPGADEPDLIGAVRAALDHDEPLVLLGLVSAMLAALEPSRPGPFDPEPQLDAPTLEELVASFLDVDLLETSALLAAMAALSSDEMLRRRIGRELTARAPALPRWLADLSNAAPSERVIEVVHVLGDGDDVLVGVRLADGQELTAVVYIDHNMGTLVKDAFVVPEAMDVLVEQMLILAADPDTEARDLDPADARARITEAIELGAITVPPLVSDSWPACRPFVEWAVAMLPEGGTGYRRPEWDADDRAELVQRFLASPDADVLDDPDHEDLLEPLLWFGTHYGPGDPLRWSATAVEILLLDWIPRKIVAEVSYLAKAPEVLRAFIRFSHQERGVRAELTAETLAALDEFEPEYQRLIRSPRPQGPAALLAAMGAFGVNGPWDDKAWTDEEPSDYRDIMLDTLRRAVGGQSALDGLGADPLPDEPFAWDAVPADVHDRVGEVLALVERCCDELLDTEYRTACRRFLAAAAAGDPEIFRRRGKPATAAAAVCWVIGKGNSLFDYYGHSGGLLVKDLTGFFGLGNSSVSQRSEPLLRAVGVDPQQYGGMDLGSPRYLVSSRRAQILDIRDHYRAVEQ